MQPVTSVLNDESLVPLARFGAALHRCRTRSLTSLASVARASEGRWLPDQLADVERGVALLDDDDIGAAVDAYGLVGRSWPSAANLELVVDRTASSEFADGNVGGPGRWGASYSDEELVRRTAARFAALSVIMGIDLTSGPLRLDALAEAIEMSLPETIELLTAVMWEDGPAIGRLIGALEHRVVVPQTGFLVGETASGSLLLVARPGTATDGPLVPAYGTLGDLLAGIR